MAAVSTGLLGVTFTERGATPAGWPLAAAAAGLAGSVSHDAVHSAETVGSGLPARLLVCGVLSPCTSSLSGGAMGGVAVGGVAVGLLDTWKHIPDGVVHASAAGDVTNGRLPNAEPVGRGEELGTGGDRRVVPRAEGDRCVVPRAGGEARGDLAFVRRAKTAARED